MPIYDADVERPVAAVVREHIQEGPQIPPVFNDVALAGGDALRQEGRQEFNFEPPPVDRPPVEENDKKEVTPGQPGETFLDFIEQQGRQSTEVSAPTFPGSDLDWVKDPLTRHALEWVQENRPDQYRDIVNAYKRGDRFIGENAQQPLTTEERLQIEQRIEQARQRISQLDEQVEELRGELESMLPQARSDYAKYSANYLQAQQRFRARLDREQARAMSKMYRGRRPQIPVPPQFKAPKIPESVVEYRMVQAQGNQLLKEQRNLEQSIQRYSERIERDANRFSPNAESAQRDATQRLRDAGVLPKEAFAPDSPYKRIADPSDYFSRHASGQEIREHLEQARKERESAAAPAGAPVREGSGPAPERTGQNPQQLSLEEKYGSREFHTDRYVAWMKEHLPSVRDEKTRKAFENEIAQYEPVAKVYELYRDLKGRAAGGEEKLTADLIAISTWETARQEIEKKNIQFGRILLDAAGSYETASKQREFQELERYLNSNATVKIGQDAEGKIQVGVIPLPRRDQHPRAWELIDEAGITFR